ncbi:MAG: type ISP restriction/modification enzyme, partial [Candidatus Sulfotelmatobacter sp.]
MVAILADFGRETRREDPVVHFYETFLAAYNPRLREMRGVYYTPEPVVKYIVRSLDLLLQRQFGLSHGLADKSVVAIPTAGASGKGECEARTHRVQILDPACGTGTFLYSVVATIQERFRGSKGMWPGYVAQHLLTRLYGFELLMAPYAVAHLKLGLQLRESGYDFAADERLRVYLTNSLEEAHALTALPAFAQWLAAEAAAASEVKRDVPIMVVLGNPPYSGVSANRGSWIENLVALYRHEPDGSPLRERRQWLKDDYVKFIRFAQWRIEQTGYGVLGLITNHGYLDNPTFRGMRHSLMETFDHIYVLDLHGNSKKRERAPDGSVDQNVFDIQQGVAICLMVRTGNTRGAGSRAISHGDLWGAREDKYKWLSSNDVSTTPWSCIEPKPPFLFFYPRSDDFEEEYQAYPGVKDAFRIMGLGFQSSRDHLVVGFTRDEVILRIEAFLDPTASDDAIRDRFFPEKKVANYKPGDTRQWSLSSARSSLRSAPKWRDSVRPTLYRPFDQRYVLYDRRMVDWPRPEVLGHMLHPNICMLVNRQSKEDFAIFCADIITERKIAAVYDASTTVPLYLYDAQNEPQGGLLGGGRSPNLKPEFCRLVAARLGLRFVAEAKSDSRSFGPEDLFAYLYALLYAPSYRVRYATFLRTDFPRLPITRDVALFRRLVDLGTQLVESKRSPNCTFRCAPQSASLTRQEVRHGGEAESYSAAEQE